MDERLLFSEAPACSCASLDNMVACEQKETFPPQEFSAPQLQFCQDTDNIHWIFIVFFLLTVIILSNMDIKCRRNMKGCLKYCVYLKKCGLRVRKKYLNWKFRHNPNILHRRKMTDV